MKITKNSETGHSTYEADLSETQNEVSVWFKFGCAHLTVDGDYVHLCEPEKLAAFLLAALAARTESFEF